MNEEKVQKDSIMNSSDSVRRQDSVVSLKNLTVEPSPRSNNRIQETLTGEDTPTPLSQKPKFSIMNSLKSKRNARNTQKNLTSFDLKDKTCGISPDCHQEKFAGDLLNLSNNDISSNKEITHPTEEQEPSKNFSFFMEHLDKAKGDVENSEESSGVSSRNLAGWFIIKSQGNMMNNFIL